MTSVHHDQLFEELRKWKHNRSIYPGWLIAPDHIRTKLWDCTQAWIRCFLQIRSNLTLCEELELIAELNWRLETGLLPIFVPLVTSFEHLVQAINPFPNEIAGLPSTVLAFSDQTAGDCDWASVRQQWLEVAFGILRYYREERNADAFEALHARLGRLNDHLHNFKARWCYEKCLFGLSMMDDKTVLHAIGQWPATTDDEIWSTRKAAVLAELGHTEQALELCSATLARLRAGLSDSREEIPALSREGWTLWLALTLRSNQLWRQGRGNDLADREELRRRFSQLKPYGCSPSELIDHFEGRLQQPVPQARVQGATTPGFQPGTITQSYSVRNGLGDSLLPAYQYIRLTEEAAQPPSVGRVTISETLLQRAGDWLCDHDPVRTQSLMIRLNSDRLIKSYLSRHRIAALPSETVLSLRQTAQKGIDQSLPRLPAAHRPESDEQSRCSSQLQCAIQLLSRLCIREDEGQAIQSWDLAIKLYRHHSIRMGFAFSEPLRDFFSSLIQSAPEDRLLQKLPALTRLPVVGEEDFVVAVADWWPDPMVMASERFDAPIWKRPTANLREVKTALVELARSAGALTRRVAFNRLMQLHKLGGLTVSEERVLAQLFWAPASKLTGLPIDAWQHATPWFALCLPEPGVRIEAGERVRQHILAHKLGEVHGGMIAPAGHFDLILFATEPLRRSSRTLHHRLYIKWTSSDIQRIVNSICTWWNDHGQGMASKAREEHWLLPRNDQTFRRFMSRLWDVIRVIVIPRMAGRSATIKAVFELIEAVKCAGLPVGAVLPATLIIQPDAMEHVVSNLRMEFANPKQEFYLSALRGIVYWDEYAGVRFGRHGTPLPPVPPDLLREISMAVALRRPESLALSLDFASNVIRPSSAKTDPQFVRNLVTGLDYLLGETAYQQAPTPGNRWTYEEVPNIRQHAARLVTSLAESGYRDDPVIQRWLNAIQNDPLPEIRSLMVQ